MARESVDILLGGTSAIGREVAMLLAKGGRRFVMACRNVRLANEVMRAVNDVGGGELCGIMRVDVSDRQSIQMFMEGLAETGLGVRSVINCIGICTDEKRSTKEGVELNYAVNFLGPVRMEEALVKVMDDGGAIVNMVTSAAEFGSLSGDMHIAEGETNRYRRYASSKLALYAYTQKLARRMDARGIGVYAADAGTPDSRITATGSWTDAIRRFVMRPFLSDSQDVAETIYRLVTERPDATGFAYRGGEISHIAKDAYTANEFEAVWETAKGYL